jgi:proteasome assembly chaperone (PAC2) family protein
MQWPENEFYFRVMDASERDVILMIGTEPHLRWRTFARTILQVAERLNVSCLITVGGLLAVVPHTVPPRLSGFASSPGLLPRLQDLGVSLSSYEGPTGILGALHDTWRNSGRPGLSLWGSVPHYISATPNPQVTVALLRRISSLLNVELEISGLERKSQLFRQQVDEALSDNPEAQEYVRQLEERLGEETVTAPAPELIQDLEEFLRRRRDTDDAPPS